MNLRYEIKYLASGIKHYWTERCTFDYESCVAQCEEPPNSRITEVLLYKPLRAIDFWWKVERAGRVWRVIRHPYTGVLQDGVSLASIGNAIAAVAGDAGVSEETQELLIRLPYMSQEELDERFPVFDPTNS